jgi:hypothetical protein
MLNPDAPGIIWYIVSELPSIIIIILMIAYHTISSRNQTLLRERILSKLRELENKIEKIERTYSNQSSG